MPQSSGALMPIGRFARACRLTIKALRHYDDERLLRPAHVDERTGYRYYTREQVRDAMLIGMMRGLGIGISTIRAFLEAPLERRDALLQTEVRRIEAELAQRRLALGAIERFGASGALTAYDVSMQRLEPLEVASANVVTTAERLVADTTALIYDLFDDLKAAGREILAPVFCMNDDSGSEEHIVVHACVRVESPPPTLARARTLEMPGGAFAMVRHVGPYEGLGLAYHALYAWAQEHGHESRGLIREVYVNDPATASPEALETEVLMPL